MECDEYQLAPLVSLPQSNGSPSVRLPSLSMLSGASQYSDYSSTASTSNTGDSAYSITAASSQLSRISLNSEASYPSVYHADVKSQGPGQRAQAKQLHVEIPADIRQHPRRTAAPPSGRPPSLVRQSDRKNNFVDNLVDSSMQIVVAIWPMARLACRAEVGNGVLPLRTFLQETLRRSRTSYSTLQVALYYLLLIKSRVPAHDFTVQADDCDASRPIQCGRRMFLAALILASKYLQDRNYSARAWSKISGLGTVEINRNEMAFLLAVNWKLHISDDVYHRWTSFVTKYTPSQPPSPGGGPQLLYDRECINFRNIIQSLTPDLEKIDELAPLSPVHALSGGLPPMTLFTPFGEGSSTFGHEIEQAFTPRSVTAPTILEPRPESGHTPARMAPALGLLPTPRATPQAVGFSTPAAGTALYPRKGSAMGFAMSQASGASLAQGLDRLPTNVTSIPSHGRCTRRSSLANSVSTSSSPESMVSDSSQISRSSSISSASSLANTPAAKLLVQARYRSARQYCERISVNSTITTVREDHEEGFSSASATPSAVAGATYAWDPNMETSWASCQREIDEAARALQGLHQHEWGHTTLAPMVNGVNGANGARKRKRSTSLDKSIVQENVREILTGNHGPRENFWSDEMVRPPSGRVHEMSMRSPTQNIHKRVCYSTTAASDL